jgi:hypothetical protein
MNGEWHLLVSLPSKTKEECRIPKFHFVGCRPNQSLELTAIEHRGSARKGMEEFALSGLGKRLLAAVQVGR